MEEKLIEELMTRLDVLAAKLGVTVEHLWDIFTKQAYIEGFYAIFWAISFSAMLFCGHKLLKNLWNEADEDIAKGFTAIGFMVLYIFCVVEIGCSIDHVRALINPEYFAFKEILKLIN